VKFVDATHGWAVGRSSVIIATADGGRTWTQQLDDSLYSPPADFRGDVGPLFGVDFIDAARGWAVGKNGGILATTNGGASWRPQVAPFTERPPQLQDVAFTDASRGWAVGVQGTVLVTTDGGATWRVQVAPGAHPDLKAVAFPDPAYGIAVGDKGQTVNYYEYRWARQVSGTTVNLNGVSFVDATHGWAVGVQGTVRATDDGGRTWKPMDAKTNDGLLGVSFSSTRNGAIVSAGEAWTTDDGGGRWSDIGPVGGRAVDYRNPDNGWTVGNGVPERHSSPNQIFRIWRGGTRWLPLNAISQPGDVWKGVAFATDTLGVVVGDKGVRVTEDETRTWRTPTVYDVRRNPTSDFDLNAVSLVGPQHGWAVGTGGTVLASFSGNLNQWTMIKVGTQTLWGVKFIDDNHGWAVGDGGVIWATTNGADWTPQASTTAWALRSVSFADAAHGWAVGESGTILFYGKQPLPD
jgi:photosystem II stability/assembly factor-like uncharacterized protein